MKINAKIVIFKLDTSDGMPIYVGDFANPDFITDTGPPFGVGFDSKIEQILAEHDITPEASYYKVRLRQACVLT